MPKPTEEDKKRVKKNGDDAIADLAAAVVGREVPRGPYGKLVHEAAFKVVKAHEALKTVYNYKITNLDEYRAELERRRQIGLTIDPATAETTSWHADIEDPYAILDPKYHAGSIMRERFARDPGGEWVVFEDLPEATYQALQERAEAHYYALHPNERPDKSSADGCSKRLIMPGEFDLFASKSGE